jgi:hypothetical protein
MRTITKNDSTILSGETVQYDATNANIQNLGIQIKMCNDIAQPMRHWTTLHTNQTTGFISGTWYFANNEIGGIAYTVDLSILEV